MFKILKNAWAVPDLRKKILIVLALILVFRFGSYIPVPGIDRTQLELLWFNQTGVGGLFNIISGGALSQISIFAMSITPYINASIKSKFFDKKIIRHYLLKNQLHYKHQSIFQLQPDK